MCPEEELRRTTPESGACGLAAAQWGTSAFPALLFQFEAMPQLSET